MKKKIVSLLLALTMMVSLLPVQVLAAGDGGAADAPVVTELAGEEQTPENSADTEEPEESEAPAEEPAEAAEEPAAEEPVTEEASVSASAEAAMTAAAAVPTLRGDSLDLHVALGGSQVLDTDQVGGIAVRGQVVQGHADHDLVALVAVGVCVCVRVVVRRTAGCQAEHHDQRQQHCKDFLHVFLLYCILIYNNGLRRY